MLLAICKYIVSINTFKRTLNDAVEYAECFCHCHVANILSILFAFSWLFFFSPLSHLYCAHFLISIFIYCRYFSIFFSVAVVVGDILPLYESFKIIDRKQKSIWLVFGVNDSNTRQSYITAHTQTQSEWHAIKNATAKYILFVDAKSVWKEKWYIPSWGNHDRSSIWPYVVFLLFWHNRFPMQPNV